MSATAYAPLTHNGTTTSFIPFTTPWTVPTSCSSLYMGQADKSGRPQQLYAFHVKYGVNVTSTATCLPTEATKQIWWPNKHPSVATHLAPFSCPVSWYEAWTGVTTSSSTATICCPSGYNALLQNSESTSSLSACTSGLRAKTSVTYAYPTNGSYSITSYLPGSTLTVSAFYLAGWNVPSATSNSSSESQDSSGDTLSTGAKVGIGLGVSLGVVGILTILTLIYFYRRRKQRHIPEEQNQTTDSGLPEPEIIPPQEMQSRDDRSELPGDVRPVYEMQGTDGKSVLPQELDATSSSVEATKGSGH